MDKCQRDEYSNGPIVFDAFEPDGVPLPVVMGLLRLQHRVNDSPFRGYPPRTVLMENYEIDRLAPGAPCRIRVVLRHRSGRHGLPGWSGEAYHAADFGSLDAILPEQPQPLA